MDVDYCGNMSAVGRYQYNFPCGSTSYSSGSDLTAGTAAVGSYKPNNWGLYDMHGNVEEWCLDWAVAHLRTFSVTDPKGATSASYRIARGGSWGSSASYCRSASRFLLYSPPSYASEFHGFRLCCPAER